MLARRAFATPASVRPNVLSGDPRRGPLLRLASLSALVAVVLAGAPALAHGEGLLVAPIEVPPPPPGEGADALKILDEVKQRAGDERARELIAEPTARARKALERAYNARSAGDAAHARMLDGLALEWAGTARDLLKAAAVEQTATAATEKSRESAQQVERARALLEETQARRGRAEAELARAEADAREAAQAAQKAEDERVAKGMPKDGAKKKKDKPKGGDAKKTAQGGKTAAKGSKK